MKVALTIAGSDSGGGAGVQADLKTFAAHNVYGVCAITAITAQNTLGVQAAWPVAPEQLAGQLEAVLADFRLAAVKTGMLPTPELVALAADYAPRLAAPIIIDPVRQSTSGAALMAPEAEAVFCNDLLPIATLVTPNIPEAEWLTGARITNLNEATEAAALLAQRYPQVSWLIKGGHLVEQDVCTDLLAHDGRMYSFTHPWQATPNTHGTGCTLASAIAAQLALGRPLPEAVALSIDYVQQAMRAADYRIGNGKGALKHFWKWS